jgi:hypothetical protein
VKKQLSQSKDPVQALQILEQAATQFAQEQPGLIQACRLLRTQASQASTKSQLETLLRRFLNQ